MTKLDKNFMKRYVMESKQRREAEGTYSSLEILAELADTLPNANDFEAEISPDGLNLIVSAPNGKSVQVDVAEKVGSVIATGDKDSYTVATPASDTDVDKLSDWITFSLGYAN
jgi:hypothetical protein